MDNLTHTLIGVLVGETAARTTSASQDGLQPQQRRNLMVTLAGIASNLPDLDFLASAISRNKLEYLLEHRGYTHTLLGTVLMAVLLWSACEGWCRWRKWTLSRSDRLQLSAVTLLALLLHVAMDFTNNYGVHPFWPFYNGWLYGDSVFIWEPLLWTAAAPLVFILRTMIARILVAALLATAIAVCLTSGLVLPAFAIFMTVLTAAMLLVGRYARAAERIAQWHRRLADRHRCIRDQSQRHRGSGTAVRISENAAHDRAGFRTHAHAGESGLLGCDAAHDRR